MKKINANDLTSSFNTDLSEALRNNIAQTTMPTLPEINAKQFDAPSNPFFLTNDNQRELEGSMGESTRNRNYTYDQSSFNVSVNQQQASMKPKVKERLVDKRKKLFNKLYGLDSFYIDNCKKAKESKNLTLERYQNNLLNSISQHQVDQQNFINLSNKFRELRFDTESISPLPKIDIEEIEWESRGCKKANVKTLTLKEYFASLNHSSAKPGNQVRFKYKSRVKPYANKVFDNLPPYLLQTLQKKMKLHL